MYTSIIIKQIKTQLIVAITAYANARADAYAYAYAY